MGFLVVVAGFVAGPLVQPCFAADTTPPQLDSLYVVPSSVDVTGALAVIHVRVVVSDDLSGMGTYLGTVYASSPSGQQGVSCGLSRTGGTELNGVFEGDMTIPRFAEPGTWSLGVYVMDQVPNSRWYYTADLASLGLRSTILVTEHRIFAVEDIGNDQGRHVRLSWYHQPDDRPGGSTTITSYSIWRRVGENMASMSAESNLKALNAAAYPPGNWDYVKSIPAHGEDIYGTVCETLCDSTIVNGQCWSVFFVRAETANPLVFFDTRPDSGYSLDNLAPGVPGNFLYAAGQLTWKKSTAEDFDYFTVYGSENESFAAATMVGHSVAPTMDVNSSPHAYYFVTATDFSGNEGKPAVVNTLSGTGGTSRSYVLSVSNHPNPFNPRTTVSYTVPSRGNVTVAIYDARGARVATLVNNEERRAAAYEVEWNGRSDGGIVVASGVYFVRIQHNGTMRSKKMVLLK